MSYLSSGTAAAVNRLFMSLLVGATILPFEVKRHGLDALAAWLRVEGISICSLSSPLFREFCRIQTDQFDLPNLRVLRLASEPAYKSDFELYRQRFPLHCLLANSVSPSETSLLSTYLMDHHSVVETDEIPIGYPVKDKEVLVIDDSGNDVGLNQIGEIAVRSSYLAQGYWNRPELTSVKFTSTDCDVAAPLYRTGDLGLRRPDGCLIHKGRKDLRLKIRGYGVEPAEVEAILLEHPAVREVCVVGRAGEISAVSRLVAYFTQDLGKCAAGSELRSFLKRRLPDYMIPTAFVPLSKLPLTDNGKVDRAGLPAPAAARPETSVPYIAPTNESEIQLT